MNEAYPDCDLTLDDLRVALREMGTYVDITEEDLLKIHTLAQQAAKDRISRSVPVSSVMTTEVAATALIAVIGGERIHELGFFMP